MYCIKCDEPIDETTDSEEHLIANSIGGWKKIPGVLCIACNSTAGHTWDSELADAMSSLCLFFQIQRDRGKVRSLNFTTTAGENIILHPDGGMNFQKQAPSITEPDEESVRLEISANSRDELVRTLQGLKRKRFPDLDIEDVLAQAQEQEVYLQGLIPDRLDFGGKAYGKSIVKSLLCLAASRGADYRQCTRARTFLQSEEGVPCFGPFHTRNLVPGRPSTVPFHCLAVSNRGTKGKLLGYVELFGAIRFVVVLADAYEGPEFHEIYAIDPVAGQEMKINVALSLSRSEVEATLRFEKSSPAAGFAALQKVLSPVLERRSQQEQERVIKEAVEYGAKNSGNDGTQRLTREQAEKMSKLVTERLQPYLFHHLVTRNRR